MPDINYSNNIIVGTGSSRVVINEIEHTIIPSGTTTTDDLSCFKRDLFSVANLKQITRDCVEKICGSGRNKSNTWTLKCLYNDIETCEMVSKTEEEIVKCAKKRPYICFRTNRCERVEPTTTEGSMCVFKQEMSFSDVKTQAGKCIENLCEGDQTYENSWSVKCMSDNFRQCKEGQEDFAICETRGANCYVTHGCDSISKEIVEKMVQETTSPLFPLILGIVIFLLFCIVIGLVFFKKFLKTRRAKKSISHIVQRPTLVSTPQEATGIYLTSIEEPIYDLPPNETTRLNLTSEEEPIYEIITQL